MHPYHSLLANEVSPGHRVACRSHDNLEALLHLWIGTAELFDRLHDVCGILLHFRRNHNVCAEYTAAFLCLLEHAGKHLLENGNIVIRLACVSLLDKLLISDRIRFSGRCSIGTAKT